MKKVLIPLALLAFLASCKKEDSASRSQMLVGSWRRAFEAQDTNRNTMLDASERKPTTDPLLLSAIYNFNADGSGSIVGNGITTSFTWKLLNNDQQFVFNIPNAGGDTSYIHTLTSDEFVLEYRRTLGYYWNGLRR